MSNQVLEDLLDDCLSYSQIQENVSQAVENFDDVTIIALEVEGRELLHRIGSRISQVLGEGTDSSSRELFPSAAVRSVFHCMEKSQKQVSKNQDDLRRWKNELGIRLQHHSSRVGQDSGLEIQEINEGGSAAETASPILTSSPLGVAHRHPIWDSRLQQPQVGQKLDHLL